MQNIVYEIHIHLIDSFLYCAAFKAEARRSI